MNPCEEEFKAMFQDKDHKVPEELEKLVEALVWASGSKSALIAIVRFQKILRCAFDAGLHARCKELETP